MTLEEWGSLAIRIAVAWLFLSGSYYSLRDLKFTENETAHIFKWQTGLFAAAGVVMMLGGGLSILFGIFPRIGALALTIFLVPAAFIHFADRDLAMAMRNKLLGNKTVQSDPAVKDDVDKLGMMGFMGHHAAGLKTLSLIGSTLYLVLAGGRTPMLIGIGQDGSLQGFLTRWW